MCIRDRLSNTLSYNSFKKRYLALALGIIQEEEFWRDISSNTVLDCKAKIANIELNNDVLEALRTIYKETGTKILIASEAPLSWITSVLHKHALDTICEARYVSSTMKTTKPFDQYFAQITTELANKDSVFLDDSIENVRAAEKSGIRSFQYPHQLNEYIEACL
jgi:FMN phosphatase YigB (HAD superfamily)